MPLQNCALASAAERGATEELIAHAQERIADFQRLADLASVDLVITDATTGAFLDCNTCAHEALGYSRKELLNLNPGRIQADPDHDDAWVAERMHELRGTMREKMLNCSSNGPIVRCTPPNRQATIGSWRSEWSGRPHNQPLPEGDPHRLAFRPQSPGRWSAFSLNWTLPRR